MLKKLISMFKSSSSPTEITLLIIGPPSSGKTALIYFLYRFATDHLTGSFKKSNSTHNGITPSQPQISDNIREVELSAFVNDMLRGIATSKDFIGTEAGTIDYINYDTGLMSLKIFNISGEIFNNTIVHGSKIESLANHLENSNIADVHCLLVDEIKTSNADSYKINMPGVKAFFASKHLSKASQIFDNVNKGINTLRVVTKFDKKYAPEKPNETLDTKSKEFSIYEKALSKLKPSVVENYLEQHKISYNTPEPVFFNGSQNNKYCKAFVCTGIYDKTTFLTDLYEFDSSFEKDVLKSRYYLNNGLNLIEMYGVTEIFASILAQYKIRKKIKIIQPLNSSRNSSHSITISDYKKILNIK